MVHGAVYHPKGGVCQLQKKLLFLVCLCLLQLEHLQPKHAECLVFSLKLFRWRCVSAQGLLDVMLASEAIFMAIFNDENLEAFRPISNRRISA